VASDQWSVASKNPEPGAWDCFYWALEALGTGHWALDAGFKWLTVKIRKAGRNRLTCLRFPDRLCCSTDIRSLWVHPEMFRRVIPN